MPVSVTSKSFSTRSSSSFSSASGLNLSGGRRLLAGEQTLVSTGSYGGRAPSVYAGAGGYGTRISVPTSDKVGMFGTYGESSLITNEKFTMQNLNDRLASYLEKVRTLESANRKLELQIREYYEKKGPAAHRDFTVFFATISDLRAQITRRYLDNQSIVLQIDNASLAADDFKIKYETELNIHNMVDGDVARLRGVRDSMTLSISDMEVQIEGLKEELAFLKRNHEEEMRELRIKQTGQVNVEVDNASSVDLTKILEEVREQYEAVATKNKLDLEKWFATKMEALQTDIVLYGQEVKTHSSELSELKRTYQSLEISRTSLLTGVQCLQQNLEETKSRYSVQLSQLQMTINMLETELQNLKASIEQQQSEYKMLLDIKMRLELEIAEYRRLLEGERQEKVIIKVVEEHKPHIERRVKTIVEEIIDGKVVSSTVDTEVQDVL